MTPSVRIAAVLLSLSAFGQQATSTGFNRPPAGVDEALRSRIQQYYELESQGKFRQAEAFVCEESRDRYYTMEKRRWTSVEPGQIVYEDGFTRARATVVLGTEMVTFTGAIPVRAPLPSLWRLENGEWCRHIPDPAKEGLRTPFGVMKAGPQDGPRVPGGPPSMGAVQIPTSAEELQTMVKVSRTEVILPVTGGSAEVEISSAMPGQVQLRLHAPEIPGFEASVSPAAITAGARATLKLSYRPTSGAATPGECIVRIVAEPIATEKQVRVLFRQ